MLHVAYQRLSRCRFFRVRYNTEFEQQPQGTSPLREPENPRSFQAPLSQLPQQEQERGAEAERNQAERERAAGWVRQGAAPMDLPRTTAARSSSTQSTPKRDASTGLHDNHLRHVTEQVATAA